MFFISFNIQWSQSSGEKLIPPLKIPLLLSGNFGELRGSHMHAGLDIKTKGTQGVPVYASWEGEVDRIIVSTSGYGKALYIKHNNGKTTVYAHLKKFAPQIEKYIKSKQYEKQTYTLQVFPKKEELKVSAGELIGFSGNTGGSLGPHLHFEIRESLSQKPINPLHFSLAIEDHQRPQLRELFLYHHIDGNPIKKQYSFFKENDSLYSTALLRVSGKISVGLNIFDRQDLSYNKNGVYSISLLLNGIKKYERKMDTFSFADSKYISLLLDQKALKKERKKIEHLMVHPKNKMSMINDPLADGYLDILPGKSYLLSILLRDFHDNLTQLDLYFLGDDSFQIPSQKSNENAKRIETDKDYLFEFKGKEVYIPKEAFFDSKDLVFTVSADTLQIEESWIKSQKPIKINFTKTGLSAVEREQITFAKIADGKPIFIPTKNEKDHFTTSIKALGTYTLVRDSIAPSVQSKNFKNRQSIKNFKYLTFRIDDEFSGIKNYEGYINKQWILLEYEPKTKTLSYDISDLKFESNQFNIELTVEDGMGNKTEFKTEVFKN